MFVRGYLEGSLVRLRSALPEDAEYTYNIRQDKEKTRYIHAVMGTIDDQRRWIEAQRARNGDYFFLAERKDGTLIGTYGIYEISGDSGVIGRALLFGHPMENAEVYLLSMRFAFETLGLRVLRLTVHEENVAAIGLNKRFGAQETGRVYTDTIGAYERCFEIREEDFRPARISIEKLIARFASRI